MLSGIGPAAQLGGHGIATVVDLPGVGRNLQDHLLFGVGYQSLRDLPFPALLAEAGMFLYTGPASRERRTGPAVLLRPDPVRRRRVQGGRSGIHLRADPGPAAQPGHGDPALRPRRPTCPWSTRTTCDDERGRRRARARHRDQPRAGAHQGVRRAARPGAGAGGRRWPTGPRSAEYVRANASTVWHPVGTCRMGSDRDAVVDARLRVHGVARLRVADASVMPTITCGNTNAATIMIAEKAADLIAADRPA